jgi:hypothetical protein
MDQSDNPIRPNRPPSWFPDITLTWHLTVTQFWIILFLLVVVIGGLLLRGSR